MKCIYGLLFNITGGGLLGSFIGGFSYFYLYDIKIQKKKLECPGFTNIYNYGCLVGLLFGGFLGSKKKIFLCYK